ncbi:MAG: FAD-binding oxidoreductase [Candidatus Omnitrophica bacterium]|nr:FAD-binding oxidoreductase [Candidatus Omnitrophota bacterium]
MIRKYDINEFASYLEDSSGMSKGYAREIVFPESEREVLECIREANEKKFRITVSGAGTGIVGGRIPYGGSILSTDKLNRISEITTDKGGKIGRAIIEPGVRIEDLKKEAKKAGLTYLPDPTEQNAFIGGTVATNASGARGFKYGATRNYIDKLNVVLANGQLLKIARGRRILKDKLCFDFSDGSRAQCALPDYAIGRIKNSAGYFLGQGTDLIDLFIGQEGTLGVITRIEVKLNMLPGDVISGVGFFKSAETALEFVSILKKQACAKFHNKEEKNIDACCLEYFDRNALKILQTKYAQIPKQKAAAVYFEEEVQDGNPLLLMGRYAKVLTQLEIPEKDIWFSDASSYAQLFQNMRHELPCLVNEIVKNNGFAKISTDISVADGHFLAMHAFYENKLKETKVPYCMFGHIGENHMHINFMPESEQMFNKAKGLYRELLHEAVRREGTIAAEHGIGKLKAEYLELMFDKRHIQQMATVKKTVDPNLLLGIGNIFKEDYLSQV